MDVTVLPDFSVLTLEDLQEEYKYLFGNYQSLKICSEESQQKIYELKRNLNTAKAAEEHLSQELELIMTTQDAETNKYQTRHDHEFEEYKRKFADAVEINNDLEKIIFELRQENDNLKEKLEEFKNNCRKLENDIGTDQSEKESNLQKENLELLANLEEFQEHIQKSLIIIAERDGQIEMLNEQVQCFEENIKSKCEELFDKTTLLESTQEQMIEMNAELAMLKSTPENINRKGNSLFAEVDDQRQVMKQLLAAQKKNYVHMKKVYNESEYEIRRLKRENGAMHNELQACSSIFLNAKKTYEEKLNERIHEVLKQNENLEKKLKMTQDRLITLSNENGISWLDSMLSFCKNETEELKAYLHNCRLQKSLVERNLQKSQQEHAKWRFEALISRCKIIERESLLDENGIKFKEFNNKNFQVSEKEIAIASPNILIGKRRSLTECLNVDINVNSLNNKNENIKVTPKHDSLIEVIKPSNKINIKTELDHPKENVCQNNLFEIFEDTVASGLPELKIKSNCQQENIKDKICMSAEINLKLEQKENCENKYNFPKEKEIKKLISKIDENEKKSNFFEIFEDTTNCCLPILNPNINNIKLEINKENTTKELTKITMPSILVKERKILTEENDLKYVKFDEECMKKDDKTKLQSHKKRTNSNIVIRKIFYPKKQ